ncbi:MAG: hypothetical protein BHW55_02595 [Candidatus Melainabacteria bacterium 35_41]|nr:MAG: hypothetical protein BHW55_02595 [Candidatus Melainabacteria bacterium 35_41]
MSEEKKYDKELHDLIRKKFTECFEKEYIIKHGYNKIAYNALKKSFIDFSATLLYWQFLLDLSIYITKTPEIFDNLLNEERENVYLMIKQLDYNIDNVNLIMDDFIKLVKII